MDSPFAYFLPEIVLLAVIVLIISGWREPPSAFWRQLRGQLDQLGNELDRRIDRNRWLRRLPVFSAETIHGKEAEFIRERLPRKAPLARFVVLLFLIGVFLWLFARQFG
jgi:RsiW-degrading membrane proteinase PrsW (M82 family)